MADESPNENHQASEQPTDISRKLPSSLTSHLRTNYVPTDEELAQILEWLSTPVAEIVKVSMEMEKTFADYNALVARHNQMQQEYADYRALASPMRRIPIDLLREVFFYCLPDNHNAIMNVKEAPLVLTRVCSAWRAVALSTPVLWASFHLPLPHEVDNSHGPHPKGSLRWDKDNPATLECMLQKRSKALAEWISRSGQCKLDISVYDKARTPFAHLSHEHVHCEGFFDQILSLSRRWRSMKFTCTGYHLRRIAALTAEDVPALEEISIVVTDTDRLPQIITGIDDDGAILMWNTTFFNAPRLRKVSLINISENVLKIPLPWKDLVHLSVEGSSTGGENMKLSNISTLLRKCPSLVSTRLEIAFPDDLAPGMHADQSSLEIDTSSQIVLHNLSYLSLHNSGGDLSTFFSILDVPSLKKFEYHTNATLTPSNDFVSFLTQISDTLVNLTFDAQRFTRADVFAALKAARRLKKLSIRAGHSLGLTDMAWFVSGSQHFDDIFLGMLVGKRLRTVEEALNGREVEAELIGDIYAEVLLPELEMFDCSTSVDFSDDGLLEFLKLRQRSGVNTNCPTTQTHSKLKRLRICLPRDPQKWSINPEIESLKDGLELFLSFSFPRYQFSSFDGISGMTSFPFYTRNI